MKAINSYFQLIVDEVLDGKGDLLKFAGDAVFIEWKATPEIDLEHCVEAAALCAAKIVSRCADFTVVAPNGASSDPSSVIQSQEEQIIQLNVHCGIGAGNMVGVHVGNDIRREYLLLGQPIQQATIATDFSQVGEVAVSAEALSILKRVCDVDESIANSDGKTPVLIATRGSLNFSLKQRRGVHQPKVVTKLSRGVTCHVEGLEVDALRRYRRMMSLYVHRVVADNDAAASNNFKSTRTKRVTAQERHREEAELRNVFVMFVNPIVEVRVTKNEKANKKMYKLLDDIMNLSTREIERYCGHLRQFIVDDKGNFLSWRFNCLVVDMDKLTHLLVLT
jgi:hypothetical protein